jgi:hypothetical protein
MFIRVLPFINHCQGYRNTLALWLMRQQLNADEKDSSAKNNTCKLSINYKYQTPAASRALRETMELTREDSPLPVEVPMGGWFGRGTTPWLFGSSGLIAAARSPM